MVKLVNTKIFFFSNCSINNSGTTNTVISGIIETTLINCNNAIKIIKK